MFLALTVLLAQAIETDEPSLLEKVADWIGHFDVPGSEFVEGALAEDSWGQLRRFTVAPKSVKFDGTSLAGLLKGTVNVLPERMAAASCWRRAKRSPSESARRRVSPVTLIVKGVPSVAPIRKGASLPT